MSLQLIKIEEGLCAGEILFHEYGNWLFISQFLFRHQVQFPCFYVAKPMDWLQNHTWIFWAAQAEIICTMRFIMHPLTFIPRHSRLKLHSLYLFFCVFLKVQKTKEEMKLLKKEREAKRYKLFSFAVK